MSLTIGDQYYLKAEENYPYALEFVIENLNYALSYDDDHPQANCLMGKLYMYQMKEYKAASVYFERALQSDISYPDTFKHYSLLKIWQSDMQGALKLINFGMKVSGMNKSALILHKALIFECLGEFRKAKFYIKRALLYALDREMINEINHTKDRIKRKAKMKRQKSRSYRSKMIVA